MFEYLLSSVTNLSFTVMQNTMKTFSQRLLKCFHTCIYNSFLKERTFIKNHIIYVYSFHISCCQRYKNIYNPEPFNEICLNPSGFEMRSLHFFCNNISGVPAYPLACDFEKSYKCESCQWPKVIIPRITKF